MKKKLLAMILAIAMMLTLLSACGSSSSSTTEETSTETTTEEATTEETTDDSSEEAAVEADDTAEEEEDTAAEAVEEAAEEEEGDVNAGLVAGDEGFDWSVFEPLCEETTTLTMFYSQPPMLASLEDSPNDMSYLYQTFEEVFNVHIEFQMVNMMDASTQFTLMVASGENADIINDVLNYYDSADQAVEDGAAINILDYAEYMPNFSALMEEYPQIETDLKTDSGMIVNFPRVDLPESDSSESGFLIRQDWLDELGLEIPQSYDEMHDVLVAFKSAYDISDPYVMPYQVLSPWGLMAGGYGISVTDDANNFYLDGDTVALSTISDAYYDYLCMFRDWYEEGLISSDFTSYQQNLPDDTLISNEQTGIWFSDISYIKTYEDMVAEVNPNAQLSLMGDPGIDDEKTGYIATENTFVGSGGFSISETCENPELAVAWCDIWYDPDLTQFINYGYEGETFEYDENGDPVLGGYITDNEFGLTVKLANGLYLCTSGGFIYDWHKYDDEYSDLQKSAYTEWIYEAADPSTVTTSAIPSTVSPDTDEAATISAVMSDIRTYVAEMALKFVTGVTELNESTYAEYVANIEAMGLQQALDAEQSAYDRYLER